MRTLAFTILTMGIALSGQGKARAQTYDPAFPVCMTALVPWGGGHLL